MIMIKTEAVCWLSHPKLINSWILFVTGTHCTCKRNVTLPFLCFQETHHPTYVKTLTSALVGQGEHTNVPIFREFEEFLGALSFLVPVLLQQQLVGGSEPNKSDSQSLLIPCLCSAVLAQKSFSHHEDNINPPENIMFDALLGLLSFLHLYRDLI